MGAAGAIAGVQAGTQLFGAYEQSQSIKAEGAYQRQQAYASAKFLDYKAKDAEERGRRTALTVKTQARSTSGSQRAALAAQGIDISTGSAGDIIDETRTLGELDALTVKNNAWREAFGFKSEAGRLRLEGENAYLAAKTKSSLTLLTGGLNAIGTGANAFAARGGQ